MKNRKRGGSQSTGRRRKNSGAKRRHNQIRTAEGSSGQSVSRRRAATASAGKLDKSSTVDALKSMGFAVDADGPIDMAEARQVAEGAAVSAAQALGVNIVKPDGSLDTAKAQQAVSRVLGFSIGRDGSKAQTEARNRVRQAAIEAAESLNVDIRDGTGAIDTRKARQVAELSLDLQVAKKKQLGRREAVDALNSSLKAMTGSDAISRRDAGDAIEKLLSSQVLVDGEISRRKSLEILKTAIHEAQGD